jgi:hypothetical protein
MLEGKTQRYHHTSFRFLTLMRNAWIGYRTYGWDAMSSVRWRRRSQSFQGLDYIAEPSAQLGLWPTPRGGLLVADAHAIKVCGIYHSSELSSN